MSSSSKTPRNRRTRKRNASATKVQVTTSVPAIRVVQPQRRRRRRRRNNIPTFGVSRMLPCTRQYLAAIGDPFDPIAYGACVPAGGHKTQKIHASVKSFVTLSANGIAWLAVCPTLANNMPVIYTGQGGLVASLVMAPFSANDTLVTGVSRVLLPQLPYARGSFIVSAGNVSPQAVSGRIVSAGLRLRYIGKETDRSGQIYMFRDPDHLSVQADPNASNTTPTTNWSSRLECMVQPLDRSWHLISDFAKDDEDFELTSYAKSVASSPNDNMAQTKTLYPFSQGVSSWLAGSTVVTDTQNATQVGIPTVGVWIVGTANSTVAYEYTQHCEFSGPPTAAVATRVDEDTPGAHKIVDAANDAQGTRGDADKRSYGEAILDNLAEMDRVARRAAPFVNTGLRAAMSAARMARHYGQRNFFPQELKYDE